MGPSGPPFWLHCPLSSVDQESGWEGSPAWEQVPPRQECHLLCVGPQPLLGRTPQAVCLDLHVHGADVARLVLPDPQLPVFGWVHFSKQLVHRLDCLQGMEKRDIFRGSGRARDISSEPRCLHPRARQSSLSRGL